MLIGKKLFLVGFIGKKEKKKRLFQFNTQLSKFSFNFDLFRRQRTGTSGLLHVMSLNDVTRVIVAHSMAGRLAHSQER